MADRTGRDGKRRADGDGTDPGRLWALATVTGGDGNDFIHRAGDGHVAPPGDNDVTGATTTDDTIDGGAGDDIVYADDGSDKIIGGLGTDELHGGAGSDKFFVYSAAEISGLFEVVDGGEFNDFLVLEPPTDNEVFDLTQVSLSSIEFLAAGLNVPNGVVLSLTSDQLGSLLDFNLNGSIHIDDKLDLNHSYFEFIADNIFLSTNSDNLKVDGGSIAFALLSAGDGDDKISFTGEKGGERLLTIHGDAGDDQLSLHRGTVADFDGGIGDDRLTGGRLADTLNGGADDDTLQGGHRGDTLTGGTGADLFVYTDLKDSTPDKGTDTITDFSHAEGDRIDLSAIDANTNKAGDQSFHFVAGGAFTGHASQLIQFADGDGNTIVQGDVNGDGTADFELLLHGAPILTGADFVL